MLKIPDFFTTPKVSYLEMLIIYFVCSFLAQLFLLNACEAGQLYVGISRVVDNSSAMNGRVGYRHGNFELEAGLFGYGQTHDGYLAEPAKYVSVSRIVQASRKVFGFQPYAKLGVLHTTDHPLIGHTNFTFGAGLRYKSVELNCEHASSGGVFETNRGITYCGFNAAWRF